jgi:hypothetical protein
MIVWRRVCMWFYVRGFDPEGYPLAEAITRISRFNGLPRRS